MWNLDIKSNFPFPIKFKNYSIGKNSSLNVLYFSQNIFLYSHKGSLSILNVSLSKRGNYETTLIFLSYLTFNIPVTFYFYDGRSEVFYYDAAKKEQYVEKCTEMCKSFALDYEIFSNEEFRKKNFLIKNPNPAILKLKLMEVNSSNVQIELDSYYNENKEKFMLKKAFKSGDFQYEICSFCSVEIKVTVRSEKSTKESFYLELNTEHSKMGESFKIFGVFETINGSLLIPSSSNIRFQEGFPGIVQTRIVPIKSSFDIECKVLGIESADPRIIPYILKDVIEAHSKEEFLKVVFDPSTGKKDTVKTFI